MTNICNDLNLSLGEAFECHRMGEMTRIRTPFTYPDGDVIDVYLDKETGALTDLGETLRWLRMQTASMSRTVKQQAIIDSVCDSSGLTLVKGEIRKASVEHETLLTDVVNISQCCIRVSDIWFTYRNRAIISVADEVADFLLENDVAFERNKRFAGISGKQLTLDFHIPKSQALIHVMSTTSTAAKQSKIDHAIRLWYDLTQSKSDQKFITVLDDSSNLFDMGEIELLQSASTVAHWSSPTELLDCVAT